MDTARAGGANLPGVVTEVSRPAAGGAPAGAGSALSAKTSTLAGEPS